MPEEITEISYQPPKRDPLKTITMQIEAASKILNSGQRKELIKGIPRGGFVIRKPEVSGRDRPETQVALFKEIPMLILFPHKEGNEPTFSADAALLLETIPGKFGRAAKLMLTTPNRVTKLKLPKNGPIFWFGRDPQRRQRGEVIVKAPEEETFVSHTHFRVESVKGKLRLIDTSANGTAIIPTTLKEAKALKARWQQERKRPEKSLSYPTAAEESVAEVPAVGYSEIGDRETQEDRFVVGENWAAVIDGMGGPGSGAEAAETIKSTLKQIAVRIEKEKTTLPDAIKIANNAVRQAKETGSIPSKGGGATIVMARRTRTSRGSHQVEIAYLGDAQAFVVSPTGHIENFTYPDSQVGRLWQDGILNERDAKSSPAANIVSSAVQGKPLSHINQQTFEVKSDDFILLTCDGAGMTLTNEQIGQIVAKVVAFNNGAPLLALEKAIAEAIVKTAIKTARKKGKKADNTTAVVL